MSLKLIIKTTNIVIFLSIILANTIYAEEKYEFTIMGNSLQNDIVKLPDKSIFNVFSGKGAFSDNKGNIGDFSSRGVRQTNNKGVLTKLTAVLIFKTTGGSEMWGSPTRAATDLLAGAGYFDVFSVKGNLKELLGKRCQYALTNTKNKSFIMQGFCK